MDCTEFRERYSEFRDVTVTAPRELKRFHRHLSVCVPCRVFDAALHAGVGVLRLAPALEPSRDFRRNLDARLAREATRRPVPAMLVRVAAAALLAVAVTLVAREASRGTTAPPTAALPPVAFPKPVANAGVPLVTFQDPRASVMAGNPYPYGTALVQPAAATLTQPATAGR